MPEVSPVISSTTSTARMNAGKWGTMRSNGTGSAEPDQTNMCKADWACPATLVLVTAANQTEVGTNIRPLNLSLDNPPISHLGSIYSRLVLSASPPKRRQMKRVDLHPSGPYKDISPFSLRLSDCSYPCDSLQQVQPTPEWTVAASQRFRR